MKKNEDIIVDNEEKKKSFFNKNFVLVILLIVVSLVGIFFASTYIRWNAEISELNEIIYYGQDDIKITELKDFYGNEMSTEINDYQALRLYCTSEYGNECLIGDYVDTLENLFRSPRVVINIVILIDLIIVYILIKDKKLKKVFIYAVSLLILLYGIYSLGFQIYKLSDYIGSVNDSQNVTQAKIIRGVVTSNEDRFKPIIEYTTEKGTNIIYLDYIVKGNIEDKIDDTITVYYKKKDVLDVEVKRSFWGYILPTILSIVTIIMSVIYFKLKDEKKKEENERS
ncbi:MAG TPA: hypothetical protein IAC02_08450 [Candidatus Coprovivens excrementavium]|nr:hypothetical protein [Candidatus Coprovivens excrementavium]